jgi:hypothetical protein
MSAAGASGTARTYTNAAGTGLAAGSPVKALYYINTAAGAAPGAAAVKAWFMVNHNKASGSAHSGAGAAPTDKKHALIALMP